MAQPAAVWPAAGSERSAALVAGAAQPAQILAAFPGALYLGLDGGGLLPLVAPGGLVLPTAVRVARPRGTDWGVMPGAGATVGGGEIHLPGVTIRVTRTWRPHAVPVGAGPLEWRPVAELVGQSSTRLREEARALVNGLAHTADPGPRVRGLVGAGPGLTPSGDDVVCGVLLALRLSGRAGLVDLLWPAVQARLASTTSLSAALLAEASQGYAVPPLVALTEALVAHEEPAAVAHAREVRAIGHTSGGDLLAGLWGALDASDALRSNTTRPLTTDRLPETFLTRSHR